MQQDARNTLACSGNLPSFLKGSLPDMPHWRSDALKRQTMMLNRDSEIEQKTGECSYCGQPLHWIEPDLTGGYYDSCPHCDEYDDWGWIEDYDFDVDDQLPLL